MKSKKYVYSMEPEDFYSFLVEYSRGVEILSEGERYVEFATYEPLQELKPLDVLEVKLIKPERAFRPVRVKDLMILPSWIKPVVIHQASAFGTGLHPTTQICLELLQKYLQPGWSVLDVGTGTGILAIASKRLGAGSVLAIDTDPLAVHECRRNVLENGVEVECLQASPGQINRVYDLVVANLELSIFRGELPFILPLFRSVAIFSGIYGEEELQEFLSLLEKSPAKIKKKDNWYGVVLKNEIQLQS